MIVAVASPADALAMAAAPGVLRLPLTRSMYRILCAQMSVSDAYALREMGEDAPFAIAGGAFLPAGGVEAWFLVRPGGLGAGALKALIRHSRERLDATGMRAICFVGLGNREGQRLARLIGFEPGQEIRDGAQEWRREACAR